MFLNTLKPAPGSKHNSKRVGRGIGCGKGKTCGRGHKGQRARAGGYHKVGFEGGQMPLARRLPKFGFTSLRIKLNAEVRLDQIAAIDADQIDLLLLKNLNIVASSVKKVKVIASGNLDRAVKLVDLHVTAGARTAITAAGGTVE